VDRESQDDRVDDLSGDSDLPRPGTREPRKQGGEDPGSTDGPGNVSVDEPTAPAMDPDPEADDWEGDEEGSSSPL
jgi:hypothetical protein